ncbi:MAG: 50S ribosomal protein L6 [Alphaproteobacteria bacterium]|nr:MAG: 50S ribosomal protein L6 [Alphaproteobacteria bacterium]
MSRLIRNPIMFGENVKIAFDKNVLTISGVNGESKINIPHFINLAVSDNSVQILPKDDVSKADYPMLGTMRSLIKSAILGVNTKFVETLDLFGTGYKAAVVEGRLEMQLGYSHPIILDIPSELTVVCPKPNVVEISGIDKQQVGQFVVHVQSKRKPRPYKGGEIRRKGQFIRKKAGKR